MKGMAASRYYTHVLPRFVEVQSWLWHGSTEKEIAKALGVSISSLARYKREHPDFCELLQKSKGVANARVEHAAFDLAIGYTRKVEQPIKTKCIFYDDDGRKCEEEKVEIFMTEEYCPPQAASIKFWLINRDPAHWRERFEAEISGRMETEISDAMIDRMAEAFGYGKSKDQSDAGA
jgi:transcriptional regulator with XRE-family HTH domain